MQVTEAETALAKQIGEKSQQYLAERRKVRELTKHLRDITACVTICLTHLDAEMARLSSPERGGRIARISNALNLQNDIARRFGLGER